MVGGQQDINVNGQPCIDEAFFRFAVDISREEKGKPLHLQAQHQALVVMVRWRPPVSSAVVAGEMIRTVSAGRASIMACFRCLTNTAASSP